MKKTVALLLVLLLVLPSMIIVSTAEEPSYIKIDGKLEDDIWFDRGWIDVGIGDWEKPIDDSKVNKTEGFKIQYRTDDDYLYVGVETTYAPVATDDNYGNGKGTNFRIWTFVDGLKGVDSVDGGDETEYVTYNYIINYAYKPSGSEISLLKNGRPLDNKADAVDEAGGIITAEVVNEAEQTWTFELKIPFTAISATDHVRVFASMGEPSRSNTLWSPSYVDNQFRYADGKEVGNADAPYIKYSKEKALLLKFDDIKWGESYTKPSVLGNKLAIDNYAGYVGGTMTIMKRLESGEKTVGEISNITVGEAKDYNYFYLIAVDKEGKVTDTNFVLTREIEGGKKDSFEVPEDGYVLLCNADKPANIRTEFQKVEVGDSIKLYNVDLDSLEDSIENFENAYFAFAKGAVGVSNLSNANEIGIGDLELLTDGNKALDAGNWNPGGVALIANKAPTNPAINPKVELVLNLGEVKRVDTVDLSFYHCYNVMIGLPKGNVVNVYTSLDGFEYQRAGIYTIDGEAAAGEFGTVETILDIPDVDAQYIRLSYLIGKSPFDNPEDPKVVWEFTAMTEFAITERKSEVVYGDAPETGKKPVNIALGKPWFGIDYNHKVAQYSGDFTDGVVGPSEGFSYGAPWFVFYRNGEYGNVSYGDLKGEVIIDLGDDGKDLGGVRMQVAPGIGEAKSIKVFASNNASAWDEVGVLSYSGTANQWISTDFAKSIDARYIKVEVINAGMFFMASEIEVITYEDWINVDGLFTESIWDGDWKRVDGVELGLWQDNLVVNKFVEGFYYDYRATYSDGRFYLGAKFPVAPAWSSPGNSATDQTLATNLRLWFANDMMDAPTGSFSGLIDLAFDGSPEATDIAIISRITGYNSEDLELSAVAGEDFYHVEFSMPVSEFGFDSITEEDYIGFGISGSHIFPDSDTPGYGVVHSTDTFVYNKRETYDTFYFIEQEVVEPEVELPGDYVEDGLEAFYSATSNGFSVDSKKWFDLSGNGRHILNMVIDEVNKFTENGYHFENIETKLPADITTIVNGDEFTVELSIGGFESDSTAFNTLINSRNDAFALFRRVNGDFLEFKAAPNDMANRPKVENGLELVTNSTITITAKVGGSQKMYADGKLVAEKPYEKNMTADEMFFGWILVDGTNTKHFTADYQSLRFYSVELSAEEVEANAAEDAELFGRPDPDPDLDPDPVEKPDLEGFINIAIGKPYTVDYKGDDRDPYEGGYSDGPNGNLQRLTNGEKADDGGAMSIGAQLGGDIDYIIDLGEVMTGIKVLTMDNYGGAWGVSAIDSVEYFISDDGETFTSLGLVNRANAYITQVKGEETEWDGWAMYLELDEAVSARYIKINVLGGSHVWSSEIEIFAAEADEDPDLDPEDSDPEDSDPDLDPDPPQTYDATSMFVILSLISAAALFVVGKKRRV